MPNNAGLLMNILGSLIGQGSLPTPNQGAYTLDEQGNVVLPYNKPTLGTRMFHPDIAQQMGQYNAQAATMLPEEQLRNEIANRIATGNVNKSVSAFGQTLDKMDPTARALLANRDPSATSLSNVATRSAEFAGGVPQLTAENIASGLKANTAVSQAALGNNLAQREALSSGAAADYGSDYYNAIRGLVQPRVANELGQISAETERRPSTTANVIAQNQVGTNEALRQLSPEAKSALNTISANRLGAGVAETGVQRGLAETGLANLPTQQATLGRNIATTGFESLHPNVDTSNLTQPTISADGTISLQRNPLFVSPLQKMQGLTQGTGQVVPGIRIPNMPVSMTTGQLITGQASNAPVEESTKPFGQVNLPNQPLTGQEGAAPSLTNFESFIDTLSKGKSDPKKDPNTALQVIAEYLGKNFRLPTTVSERESSKYIGGSNLRFPAKSPAGVYYNAMVGKDPNLHWSDVINMLKQLPPEAQHELYSEALKKGRF